MSCKGVKEFLSARGILYKEYDVSSDKEAFKLMLEITGGKRATPIITVDNEVIEGFDRGKLERILGI